MKITAAGRTALELMLRFPQGIIATSVPGPTPHAPYRTLEALEKLGLVESVYQPYGIDHWLITDAGREVMK